MSRSPYIGGERKKNADWNEAKYMKSSWNIDVDCKGAFKWVKNSLEKG